MILLLALALSHQPKHPVASHQHHPRITCTAPKVYATKGPFKGIKTKKTCR